MAVDIVVDLRASFALARLQGDRSTCMAFSTSDCHAAARGDLTFLSAEYLHFHALRRRGYGDIDEGVSMAAMFEVSEEDGQPEESGWPYLMSLPEPISAWVPPADVGRIFRRRFLEEDVSLGRVHELLNARTPIVLVMDVSESFFTPSTAGIVRADVTEKKVNTHAVVGVGRGTEGSNDLILVRNSWGTSWGLKGYAWLDSDYLVPRLLGIGTAGPEVVKQ
jgi:hypothetical protein